MLNYHISTYVLLELLSSALVGHVAAVTCPSLAPGYAAPVMADGWEAKIVVQGLKDPRGMLLDAKGNLLVVEQNVGISHFTFDDGEGTCLELKKQTVLVNSTVLNHGIAISEDGKTLYASSFSEVFAWSYDDAAPSLGSTNRTVINGMDSGGHTSRTLQMSAKQPGTLIVSRGSSSNFDVQAQDAASGISQIKAFDLTNATDTPYDYPTQGRLLGWGLRNSVGVAEEPLQGGIYSVENSADEIRRNGVDIHQNNPGEEMNFHGYLNASTEDQGGNYGYPDCLALWNRSIPNVGTLQVGSQFAGAQNSTVDDDFCTTQRVAPRLTFQAHMAPLDIKFLPNGTEAYVSFHGSWDRSDPVGYKLSTIAFANGSPVDGPDSSTSTKDIMINPDNSACPQNCFRPVGLALDDKQRMYMSSDSTGEIYVLFKSGPSTAATATPGGSSPSPSTTTAPNAAPAGFMMCNKLWIGVVLGVVLILI